MLFLGTAFFASAGAADVDLGPVVEQVSKQVLWLYETRYNLTQHPTTAGGTDAHRLLDRATGQQLDTGYAMERADIELFLSIRNKFLPQRIFIVGNAWGFSTLVLGSLFAGVPIDVIDAAAEGVANARGIDMTNELAAQQGLDIHVHRGYSPKALSMAMRKPGAKYDLLFIDGLHTNEACMADFFGLHPYIAPKAVIVFHDVAICSLWNCVKRAACSLPGSSYQTYVPTGTGVPWDTVVKTGFLYTGFRNNEFAGYGCQTFNCSNPPYRQNLIDGRCPQPPRPKAHASHESRAPNVKATSKQPPKRPA